MSRCCMDSFRTRRSGRIGRSLRSGLHTALGICLALLAADRATAADADLAQSFAAEVRPLLAKYCIGCHGEKKAESDFRLDDDAPTFLGDDARRWRTVLERVELGQMPPESAARPNADEIKRLQASLHTLMDSAETARRSREGRVALRRLNRNEYQNTIRDLLGIDVDLTEQLPTDGSADGFDNAAAALHTSSFLMEKYLEAADAALNAAISNKPDAPKYQSIHGSIKQGHPIRSSQEAVYRINGDEVVCFCSSAWHNVSVPHLYPQEGGRFRIRISASAVQSNGKPVTFRVLAGSARLTGMEGLVGYFDAPPGEPKIIEFERYFAPKTTISILPYGLPGAQSVRSKNENGEYDGPGLAVQWVEVDGPLNESWPPASHRNLLGDLKRKPAPIYNQSTRVEVSSDDPLADADRILRRFTRLAFRRPVGDADVKPFVDVVKQKLADDYSFEQALRAALKGVLISPEFLFLHETPGKLSDEALASRLSYFLWSSMPDDELLQLAAEKKLSDPAELRRQVERMLKDRRAAAFTKNFVGQWLGLREIDFTEPSHILYPEFDHLLKVSMMRETELFFDEVLKHDLSLQNFIASDFSMLNGPLAKHYGVPGPSGWEFQRTSLPGDSRRGGVLTMASVLKVTANGTTTSPVVRGAWVMDRILGTPPPPPPGDVSAIDPDIRGATTIREQLAKHRELTACAGCHKKIDPPGFALESFDCIGGYRERYRITGNGDPVTIDGEKMRYRLGKPIDPSDETEEGHKFADVDEFKQVLLRDPDRTARALASKLITYGTGAAPTSLDKAVIDQIVNQVREKNFGFRTLIHEIVRSKIFQTK